MKIKFLGAARTVTGSMHVIECGGHCFALDCGLFQGSKEIKERNYQDFKINPNAIDFVILSHAHIDHSGLLPKLCKLGFRGPIYCNYATAELAKVMLPDSAHIQETEVERKNRKLSRAGKMTIEPIYTVEDAINCLSQFKPVNYDEMIKLADGIEMRLRDAGHILGSSLVELWLEEAGKKTKLVFSGDLGQEDQPFIKDPTFIENADFVIMESTYGDRFHKDVLNRVEKLKQIIDEAMKKGGNLIIPAFAVERTQDLLYDLNELYVKGELDKSIDVYIDSPLAIAATEIFKNSTRLFDKETLDYLKKGFHPLEFPNLRYSHSQEESMELNSINHSIIISASGMCEAGRIKHHLKHNLWRPESTILFVGYQAAGTLGRNILDGEKTVTIHGEQVTVKADIRQIEAYSSHADQAGLMHWLKQYDGTPQKVYLVHGEGKAQQTLADLIQMELGIPVVIPQWLDEYQLDADERMIKQPVQLRPVDAVATQALAAEELYLQLRIKLNRFYQDSITGQKYDKLIEKLEKLSSEF